MKSNASLILKRYLKSYLRVRATKNTLASLLSVAVALIFFQNCSQGFTIDDGFLSAGSLSGAAGSRLQNAKAVLKNKCIDCHNGSAATNFNLISDQEFILAGLVSPGSPSKSKLLYRLKNYPADMGAPRDMPRGSSLSLDEYAALSTWVENMSDPNSTNPFACNASEAPDTLNAKRLTKRELTNTYLSIVARGVGQETADWMTGNYLDINRWLPPDASSTYSTADSNFGALHAQSYLAVADQVTKFVTQSNQINRFVSTFIAFNPSGCAFTDISTMSIACQDAFIKNFVLRAWGREIETTEANSNNEFAALKQEFSLASGEAAVNNLVFRVFMSPQFYFHLNNSVTQVGPYYRLSSYSIARRLSYIFTQGPPDENLLAIASSQDLLTDAGFSTALDYLSQNMKSGINQFAYEWLQLDLLPGFKETGLQKFQYIAGPLGDGVDDRLRQAMKDEVVELVTYITNSNQGLKELFTTNVSFARYPTLMRLYNVSTPAPANITDSNAVRLPAGERSGLLTRSAIIFSGGQTENPMHRGVTIRKNLLCKTIPPPPANLKEALVPPAVDPNLTTRERYTAATSSTNCMGCHSMINPVGFAFSKYNSLGGYQPIEPIFDSGGNFQRNLPTDARVLLTASIGIEREVNDALEFSDVVSESNDVKSCFVQNFSAYENGLSSLPGAQSSCSMNKMYQALDSKASLKEVFKASVLIPQFRYRNIQK